MDDDTRAPIRRVLGGSARTAGGRAVAVAVLLVLAAGAACDGSGQDEAARGPLPGVTVPVTTPTGAVTATPTPTAIPEPTTTPAAEPTPTIDADREAELERLRATNQFLEFAEADRARHATWARFAYDRFAPHDGPEILFEWHNKSELWDSIVPAIRDECLLAGAPIVRPLWDAQIVIPASLNPTWDAQATSGRGLFIDFVCRYEADGERGELWVGVLLETSEHNIGLVLGRSSTVHVDEDGYRTFGEASDGARQQLWQWITTQPPSEDGVTDS